MGSRRNDCEPIGFFLRIIKGWIAIEHVEVSRTCPTQNRVLLPLSKI